MSVLAMCTYGEDYLGAECCYVEEGGFNVRRRCPVFDWEDCPFGKKVEGCGTCAHVSAMTELDGARMVDCDANERQMYSPYACECKHWERAID